MITLRKQVPVPVLVEKNLKRKEIGTGTGTYDICQTGLPTCAPVTESLQKMKKNGRFVKKNYKESLLGYVPVQDEVGF